MAPVMCKDWQQCQASDGTYNIDDLLDWHEMAEVKNENKRRAEIAAEQKGAG
jgi:hypothetical protein